MVHLVLYNDSRSKFNYNTRHRSDGEVFYSLSPHFHRCHPLPFPCLDFFGSLSSIRSYSILPLSLPKKDRPTDTVNLTETIGRWQTTQKWTPVSDGIRVWRVWRQRDDVSHKNGVFHRRLQSVASANVIGWKVKHALSWLQNLISWDWRWLQSRDTAYVSGCVDASSKGG